MNVEIKKYLRRVKKEVKKSGDRQLEYYGGFEREVKSFLEENPQADVNAIEHYFGSPSSVSIDFEDTLSNEDMRKKVRLHQRIFIFVRTVVIVLAMIVALLAGLFVYDAYLYNRGETIENSLSETISPPQRNSYRTY